MRGGSYETFVRLLAAVTVALGLAAVSVTPATPAAAAKAVGRQPVPLFPPARWQPYVVAPRSRLVTPVRVIASSGRVVNPDGLLHGGVTKLIAPPPPAPPSWPSGTAASVSSTHAPNGGDTGTRTTYAPGNAIDGKPATFWNDASPDTYPAWLQLDAPQPVTLPGITLVSTRDGVPEDFTVAALHNGTLQTVATVTGNTAVQRPVSFSAPVTTTEIRITVTKDQASAQGDYTRIAEVYPGVVPAYVPPSITLDFGKDVVGYPQLSFAGASGNAPGLRLGFSETRQYLSERSDYTRSQFSGGAGTDQYVPYAGAPSTWIDTDGCQFSGHVCADGLHGFRYERITLDALAADARYAGTTGEVDLTGAALHFSAYLGTPRSYRGWFDSSDPALDRYWYGASYTNELVTDHFEPTSADPRARNSPGLDGKLVLVDGAKRDRDPYDGDLAVSGLTDYLTHNAAAAVTNVLADLARHQLPDGWIPPASVNNYALKLFEYPLYWAMDSWEYVLYHGVRGYGRTYFPNLVRLLNTWYPSVTDANGLLDKGMNGTGGYDDYAFVPRTGEVTYYNDLYVLALRDGAQLAAAVGDHTDAVRWRQRAAAVSAAINARLWDPVAGAYLDSSTGAVSHPQDANGWAVLAGVAGGARARSALAYLASHTHTPYGNAFYDNGAVVADGASRVYAFTSYPEIVARFATGQADSALNEIGRLYGCMTARDPGMTDWEGVTTGCRPSEQAYTSMAHGWSTGVVPELTNELLGVAPVTPGFTRWIVAPHPGTVAWAQGQVPTPHGPIIARWRQGSGRFALQVTIPARTGGQIVLPAAAAAKGHLRIDGAAAGNRSVRRLAALTLGRAGTFTAAPRARARTVTITAG